MHEWFIFYSIVVMLLFIYREFQLNWLLVFTWLVPMIFAGIRYEVGNDYWNYLTICEDVNLSSQMEPTFNGLVFLIRTLDLPCEIIFPIFSTLMLGFIWLSAKRFKRPEVVLLLFLIMPAFFVNSLSIIRQGLACAIIFYAYLRYIENSKIIQFLAFGLIATLTHYISLPVIFFMLILKNIRVKIKFHFFIICVALATLLNILGIDTQILTFFNNGRYEKYFEWSASTPLIKIAIFNVLALYISYEFNRQKLWNNKLSYEVYKVWFFGVLIFNTFSNYEVFTRITYFFLIFGIGVIEIVFTALPSRRGNFFIGLIIFIYLSALTNSFLVDIDRLSNPDEITPGFSNYRTIFNK